MTSVLIHFIVDELVHEFMEEFQLSEREILYAVAGAAVEVLEKPEYREYAEGIQIEAIDKIEAVNVEDGEQIPAHRLEVLKGIIRKAALRRLKRLEEQQPRKAGHDDRK